MEETPESPDGADQADSSFNSNSNTNKAGDPPLSTTRKKQAPQIPPILWVQHRAVICEWYKDHTLDEVQRMVVAECGFEPTKRQLNYKLAKWSETKYAARAPKGYEQSGGPRPRRRNRQKTKKARISHVGASGSAGFPLAVDNVSRGSNAVSPCIDTVGQNLAQGELDDFDMTEPPESTPTDLDDDEDEEDDESFASSSSPATSHEEPPEQPSFETTALLKEAAHFLFSITDDGGAFNLGARLGAREKPGDPDRATLAELCARTAPPGASSALELYATLMEEGAFSFDSDDDADVASFLKTVEEEMRDKNLLQKPLPHHQDRHRDAEFGDDNGVPFPISACVEWCVEQLLELRSGGRCREILSQLRIPWDKESLPRENMIWVEILQLNCFLWSRWQSSNSASWWAQAARPELNLSAAELLHAVSWLMTAAVRGNEKPIGVDEDDDDDVVDTQYLPGYRPEDDGVDMDDDTPNDEDLQVRGCGPATDEEADAEEEEEVALVNRLLIGAEELQMRPAFQLCEDLAGCIARTGLQIESGKDEQMFRGWVMKGVRDFVSETLDVDLGLPELSAILEYSSIRYTFKE